MAGCGDRSAGNTDVDLDGDRGGGAGACYRGIQYGGFADVIFYIDRNRDVGVPLINFGRTVSPGGPIMIGPYPLKRSPFQFFGLSRM